MPTSRNRKNAKKHIQKKNPDRQTLRSSGKTILKEFRERLSSMGGLENEEDWHFGPLFHPIRNHVISRSQIQYSLVTSGTEHRLDDYLDTALGIVRECPKDLLQLNDPVKYYMSSYEMMIRKGHDIYTFRDTIFTKDLNDSLRSFWEYSSKFNQNLIKVFLIDHSLTNHKYVANFLKRIPFGYFVLIGEMSKTDLSFYELGKSFVSGNGLIDLLNKDLKKINTEFRKSHGLEIETFDWPDYDWITTRNKYYDMDVTRTNYFTLNQIWANHWKKLPVSRSPEDKAADIDKRVGFQVDQIEQLDIFHQFAHKNPPTTAIDPRFPPLILVAPYHFPNYGKFRTKEKYSKEERLAIRLSQSEQSKNYTYDLSSENLDEQSAGIASLVIKLTAQRLLVLDKMAFLHSQFTYSPVFRLPVIGKSINLELSHITGTFSNKKTAIEKMKKVGKIIAERTMTDELIKVIKDRNGQLVCISDLPMEWIRIGKYPLVMTHDICRLPEFNFKSLFNLYVHQQRLNFTIGEDIVEKTLVIHCASDEDANMKHMFEVIDSQKADMQFNSVICSNVKEITQAVRKYQPHLLIFDCHGSFDEKTLSSFLIIDGKNKAYLTGEDIIANGISAPLVFISACSTSPTYGYVKLLSDAFFQAGAFAVTATYLPIKMVDATVLIIRLINGLKQHQNSVYHTNWLAFVSHTLRGVLVYETIRKLQIKGLLTDDIEQKTISNYLSDLMIFERREKTFDALIEYVKSMNPDIDLSFEDLEHEWLSYTTIGRADLIYFDNWIAKHRESNLGKETFERLFANGCAFKYPVSIEVK